MDGLRHKRLLIRGAAVQVVGAQSLGVRLVCLAGIAIVAVLLAACGSDQLPGFSRGASSGSPTPLGDPSAPPVALDPAQLAAVEVAIRDRLALGMRAEYEYVRALELDPVAVARGLSGGPGFAVTAAEAAEYANRQIRTSITFRAITRYGESHPLQWAGLVLDERRRGLIIAHFTDDIDRHRSALARVVRPDANFDVVAVRWSLVDLTALADEVHRDHGWLATVGASYHGGGVDIASNVAVVDIVTTNPFAPDLLVENFDGEGRMRVNVIDPPQWRGEFYALTIRARTTDGDPVEGLECVLIPDQPGAWDAGYSTPTNYLGRCLELVGSTGFDIRLFWSGADGPVEVGSARFEMPARDESIVVTVNLPRR